VSVSARFERSVGAGRLYGLAEWASTSEGGFYVFHATLVEAQWNSGPFRPYARLEIADRPEDQRVFGNPFRSPRPPEDNALLGVTRWRTLTAGLGLGLPPGPLRVRAEAVGEVAWAHVTSLEGVFDPVAFYGRSDLLSVSLAVKLSAGMAMHRMGRYGVAAEPMPSSQGMGTMGGISGQ
jgi:hypothetical protein